MKLIPLLSVLLSVISSLLIIYWLHPLNMGAVGLVFLLCTSIVNIIMYIVYKIIQRKVSNDETLPPISPDF